MEWEGARREHTCRFDLGQLYTHSSHQRTEALIKTRDACSIVDIIDCLLASTYVCVLRCSKSIDGLDGMGLDLGTDLSTALRC